MDLDSAIYSVLQGNAISRFQTTEPWESSTTMENAPTLIVNEIGYSKLE